MHSHRPVMDVEDTSKTFTRSAVLYLRGVGVVLLCTFLSLATQVDILMGPRGLAPASRALSGEVNLLEKPTLLWLSTSNAMLWSVIALGVVGCALLIWGRARHVGIIAVYVAYLSLVTAGGVFFHFQWDNLVLEALALCLLLPWRANRAPHPLVVSALRFLLFRLYFESGVVKALWGKESWGAWIAMDRYYETAPLPLLLGWVAHQLPHAVHVVEEAVTFLLELVLPFGFLVPWSGRAWCVVPAVLLQGAILATASYGSFNFMSALLCLWLVEDRQWERVVAWLRRAPLATPTPVLATTWRSGSGCVVAVLCGLQMLLTTWGFLEMVQPRWTSAWMTRVDLALSPFRVANNYHLFANITLTRPTVEIQGSTDGEHWEPYQFHHAPGALDDAPPLVLAPHHPRVAFQMWFLALSRRHEAWFDRLVRGLCEEDSPVHRLFKREPPQPPARLRYVLLNYTMTDVGTLWRTGRWWNAEVLDASSPQLICGTRTWVRP
ncbi:MAG: lipase maturation factor family protein [Myxococcota bacterium]